jgi:hypothetical protein
MEHILEVAVHLAQQVHLAQVAHQVRLEQQVQRARLVHLDWMVLSLVQVVHLEQQAQAVR